MAIANHYVKNDDFLIALKDYKIKVREAEESGEPKPKIPDYLGECILKIAQHLSYKPNFINYTYRNDMISDGVENCLKYIDNFDPEKSSNPFAYFTQIIYFAFIRRIKEEKKQTLIKGKIIMDMPFDVFDVQDHDEGESYVNTYIEFMQNNGIFKEMVEKEEKRRKSLQKKAPTLESLFEDE